MVNTFMKTLMNALMSVCTYLRKNALVLFYSRLKLVP